MRESPIAIPKETGRRFYPLASGETSSPCKLRPDTGKPCILVDYPKDNQYCDNCALRGRGNCWEPKEFVIEIGNNRGIEKNPGHKTIDCMFRGWGYDCEKKTQSYTGYCAYHLNIAYQRELAWQRDHGGTPPEWFLHRPVGE